MTMCCVCEEKEATKKVPLSPNHPDTTFLDVCEDNFCLYIAWRMPDPKK